MIAVELSSLDQRPLRAKRAAKSLDESRVAYWMTNLDNAEPIVVFEDSRGQRTVADGYHRIEAAYRLGVAYINASILQGNSMDATTYPDQRDRIDWSDLSG